MTKTNSCFLRPRALSRWHRMNCSSLLQIYHPAIIICLQIQKGDNGISLIQLMRYFDSEGNLSVF